MTRKRERGEAGVMQEWTFGSVRQRASSSSGCCSFSPVFLVHRLTVELDADARQQRPLESFRFQVVARAHRAGVLRLALGSWVAGCAPSSPSSFVGHHPAICLSYASASCCAVCGLIAQPSIPDALPLAPMNPTMSRRPSPGAARACGASGWNWRRALTFLIDIVAQRVLPHRRRTPPPARRPPPLSGT